MTDKERTDKGKRLAYLLRHDTSYDFNLHGWREIRDITNNHNISFSEIIEIVKTDDKNRYEIDENMKYIRARQGHSINVDLELEEKEPPEFLYHGTATRFIDDIKKSGLLKMSRQYVHLSSDIETAAKVGIRHGKPVIIKIKSGDMFRAGYRFYLSTNGVWLVDRVDPYYLEF